MLVHLACAQVVLLSCLSLAAYYALEAALVSCSARVDITEVCNVCGSTGQLGVWRCVTVVAASSTADCGSTYLVPAACRCSWLIVWPLLSPLCDAVCRCSLLILWPLLCPSLCCCLPLCLQMCGMWMLLADDVKLAWRNLRFSGSLNLLGAPHLSDWAGHHGIARVYSICQLFVIKAELHGAATAAHYQLAHGWLVRAQQDSYATWHWLHGGILQRTPCVLSRRPNRTEDAQMKRLLRTLKPLGRDVAALGPGTVMEVWFSCNDTTTEGTEHTGVWVCVDGVHFLVVKHGPCVVFEGFVLGRMR